MPLSLQSLFSGARGSYLSHNASAPQGESCGALSTPRHRYPYSAGRRRQIVRNLKMSNPVVLITGALTGIGRATALAFAKDGAHVVASGRREAEGKALEAETGGGAVNIGVTYDGTNWKT